MNDESQQHIPLYKAYFEGDFKSRWYAVGAVTKAQNILDLCSGIRLTRLADIGAGNGAVLERLRAANIASEYNAFEISESGLAELRRRFADGGVKCLPFDGYHIPSESDYFDLAVLSHVIEHVEHPRQLLYESRRVAHRIVMEVPLEHRSLRGGLRHQWRPDSTGHINFFDFDTARRLLETSGWRVVRSAVTNQAREVFEFASGSALGTLRWLAREALLRVTPRIAQSVFCYHACYLCERAPLVSEQLE